MLNMNDFMRDFCSFLFLNYEKNKNVCLATIEIECERWHIVTIELFFINAESFPIPIEPQISGFFSEDKTVYQCRVFYPFIVQFVRERTTNRFNLTFDMAPKAMIRDHWSHELQATEFVCDTIYLKNLQWIWVWRTAKSFNSFTCCEWREHTFTTYMICCIQ